MITRRRALALAAGALAAHPAAARAGQPAADRTADALVDLVAREYAAAAGYRAAGRERFAAVCEDYARALRSQLESVGREPPEPGPAADAGDASALERELIDAYRRRLGDLYDPATKRTAATIMAGHAQRLVVLERDPLAALSRPG